MTAAFLEPERDLIGIGDDLAFVAFASAVSEAINETPESLTERMRELLKQLESVTLN